MSNARTFIFIILLVFSLVFVPTLVSHVKAQANKPNVRIDPPQIDSGLIGENFTVYVWVDNAVDIEAAQVQFTYDPNALTVLSVVEGPFLKPINPIIGQLNSTIDNETTAEVDYGSAGTTGTTVSGSGILLNATFAVISEASSTFALVPFTTEASASGTYFLDINFQTIQPTLQNSFYGSPIIFETSNDFITVGDSVTLNGSISGSSGSTVTSIGLLYKALTFGSNWNSLATIPVDNSHNFSYQWTSNDTGSYEFQVAYVTGNETHASPIVEIVVETSLHGYGIYVEYAFIALVLAVAAIVLVLAARSRRKAKAERPPV